MASNAVVGASRISQLLKQKAVKYGPKTMSGVTGYTAAYALHVHERLDIFHPNGEAKYLEKPFRHNVNDGTLVRVINEGIKAGLTLGQAIVRALLLVQRDSQKIVPVDTGALKNSAFTALESGK